MQKGKKTVYLNNAPRLHIRRSNVEIFAWIFLSVMTIVFLFPMFLSVSVSFASQDSIRRYGFEVIPHEFSTEAYRLLLGKYGDNLLSALVLTVSTGLIQPVLSIFLTVMMAYPLSRPDFFGRDFWRRFVLVTMLFSGGIVPTYILYTRYLGLKNNVLIYILPSIGAWNVFLFRTFFVNIDSSMIESAKIDGASNFRILLSIMLPLTKPLIAMNFFNGFLWRWNDITTPLYYITDKGLYTVQYMLQQMLINAEETRSLLEKGFAVNAATANIPVESIRYALAVIGALPVFFLFPYIQKFYAKGITIGSTKG